MQSLRFSYCLESHCYITLRYVVQLMEILQTRDYDVIVESTIAANRVDESAIFVDHLRDVIGVNAAAGLKYYLIEIIPIIDSPFFW